jgi:hypothetical protein
VYNAKKPSIFLRASKIFQIRKRQLAVSGFFVPTNVIQIKVRLTIMAKDVLCEVNSCRHWAQENKCSASSIYIVSHTSKEVSRSAETDCKTFEVK